MVREGGFLGKQSCFADAFRLYVSIRTWNRCCLTCRGEEQMNKMCAAVTGYPTGKKKLTDNEVLKVMKYIGSLYRDASLRADLADHDRPQYAATRKCMDDRAFVYTIERCLQNCGKQTQLVIRKEYLEVSEEDWYLQYFTKSVFRRILVKDVREFLALMDLL